MSGGDWFRKRPVVVEAFRWTPSDHPAEQSTRWFFQFMRTNPEPKWRTEGIGSECRIFIETLEGEMCCQPGDWLIRGVQGEVYPCKPDIFEATYEAAPSLSDAAPEGGGTDG